MIHAREAARKARIKKAENELAYEEKFSFLDEEVEKLLPEINNMIKAQAEKGGFSLVYCFPIVKGESMEIPKNMAEKLALIMQIRYGYKTAYRRIRIKEEYIVTINW